MICKPVHSFAPVVESGIHGGFKIRSLTSYGFESHLEYRNEKMDKCEIRCANLSQKKNCKTVWILEG